MSRRLLVSSLLLLALSARGAELDFYRDVYPVLKANCISCHNKTTTKGHLNMESPESMTKGGETGPGVIPGKSAESLVVQAAAHLDADLSMPPSNNKSGAVDLTAREIDLLKAWIDQGAKHSVQQARPVVWQPLPPGVNPIYTVAMTKDGRFAACGRANQIFLYDLATRQLVTRFDAHRGLVQSLAFSPDGMRLASGSFREVKIWRLELGDAQTLEANPAPAANEALLKRVADAAKVPVLSHALSADGQQLATGCADGAVRVWDAASGALIIELRGSVAASRQIAALEWTVSAQGLEQSFQKAEGARLEAQNKALDILLKKANETIVAMKKALPEKEKALKPVQEAKAAAQKAFDEVAATIAKAPDGQADPALQKQRDDLDNKLAAATTEETAALAAVAAVQSNLQDAEADVERITAAEAKNSREVTAATGASEAAKKLQENAAGELAAAKQALTRPGAKPVAVAFSPDAQKVAALFDDGALRAWAVATGLPVEQAEAATALTIAAAPHLVLERTLSGELFADRVNAVRFSPDGTKLAAGGGEPSRSGDISLWEVATGKLLQTWSERHSDSVLSLDFSPDGKLLASGGADKIARVTELVTGRQVNLFEGHTHHVLGVAFRADGRTLATAGGDGVVLVWDMISGERKKKIEGWGKEVTSLEYIGATSQIVTSAGDNMVRIVNDDGAVVRTIEKLPDFMQAAASTPAGNVLIGGGEDSLLRVWDGTSGKELAAFGPK